MKKQDKDKGSCTPAKQHDKQLNLKQMGFLKIGPYGPLSGRTGNTVGRDTKKGNVFAARPRKLSKPATQKQLEVRAGFSMFTSFLSWAGNLINIGFAAHDNRISAMNAAVSYNYHHAIKGVFPNLEIDYPEVLFSRGTLDVPDSPLIAGAPLAKMTFSWTPTTENDLYKHSSDNASFLVYNVDKNKFVIIMNGAIRSAGTCAVQLPQNFTDDTVHCYMAFASENGRVSNSVHVGSLLVL